jgi:preprotein translocase subunit SecY
MLTIQNKKSTKLEIFKRIMFSLGALIFVRILYFIPLPGVRIDAVIDFYNQNIVSKGGGFFDMLALLHVGKMRNLSLFSMGIIPFINSCIIVQIIGFLVPGINRKFFYGQNVTQVLRSATIIVAILLSGFHAYFIGLDVDLLNSFPGLNILSFDGILFQATTMLSVIVAVIFFIMLSEMINKYGIGNGVAVIFASEILIRFVFALDQVSIFYARELIDLSQLLIFGFICLMFITFARYITSFCYRIDFCTPDDQQFHINIRPIWIGVWPLIITEITLSFFEISLNFYSFFTVLATCAFISFLYAKIIYQPRRFYEMLLARGCKSKKNQKKKIEDCLNNAMVYCICLSIALFMVMYYLPVLLSAGLKVSFLSSAMFGPFGLIILVGLFYDISRQVRFYKKLSHYPKKKWELLTVANDEVYAQIEKAFLRSQGIAAAVRPSHFSWGLPIRTIASGYALYVDYQDREKALSIIDDLQAKWQSRSI